MSKRRNPWIDDMPLQMKTHIGVREVAYGIDGGFYKNLLEENTKQMLMEGAKEFYSKSSGNDFMDVENIAPVKKNDDFNSQAMITSYFTKSSKIKIDKSAKTKLALLGCACVHEDNPLPSQCNSCGNVVDLTCKQTCIICHQQY